MEVMQKGTVYMDEDILESFGLQPGQAALFVHAHPDDESVANAEAAYQLGQSGIQVHFLLATYGTESTLGDPHFVKQGSREQEWQAALDVLKIHKLHRHFAGFIDGQLTDLIRPLADKIGILATKIKAAVIFTPGADGFDGHPDHIAIHKAAVYAAKQMPYTPQLWALSRDSGEVGLTVDPNRKLLAVSMHHTQFPGAVDQNMPQSTAEYLANYKDLIYDTEWYSRIAI